MALVERICWALLGLVHLMPALALFQPALISRMYGASPGSSMFLLLHHRAALFLVVLVICVWAMARPEVRQLASVAVAVSMVSFIVLWRGAGSPAGLRTLAVVDLVAFLPLGYAAWAAFRTGASS
jgi:uncharacterized membrane protein